MPSSVGLPPLECCRGTSPSHAAKSRPFRKACPCPIDATIAVAPSGPIPGISSKRRQAASAAAIASSSLTSGLTSRSDRLLEAPLVLPVLRLVEKRSDAQERLTIEIQVCQLREQHLSQIGLESKYAPQIVAIH